MNILLIGVLFFTPAFNKHHCDCSQIYGYNEAKFVFTGKVIKVSKKEKPYRDYKIKFSVISVEKGTIKLKKVKIHTGCLLESCCGIPFAVDSLYQVYVIERDKNNFTNSCTLTHKID